jgi:hypothetical protein
LLVRQKDDLFGGVRRTSLLDEVICIQAMLFSIFGASLAFSLGIPPGEPSKPLWLALGTAGAIVGVLFRKVLVSGWIWLPFSE